MFIYLIFSIDKLDDKIDATMAVTKLDPELRTKTFAVGYICVAQFTVDKRLLVVTFLLFQLCQLYLRMH